MDELVVDNLVEENSYMKDLGQGNLEGASLVQILEYDEYYELPNDDHSEAEAC